MMRWIFDRLFGKQLAAHTARYLAELAGAPVAASRSQATELVSSLAKFAGPAIPLGTTPWGKNITIPTSEVLNSFVGCRGDGTAHEERGYGTDLLS